MRIRGWQVEGFGLLRDFHVDGLPNGLTVVVGPNEAGKTSLLGFIRGALFGYPDRRRKDRQHPPLRGGRHGGRLFLESSDAGWTVERFATPAQLSITQPDGAPGSEPDLRRLLGGVDAELHRNVFAFSLSELQEFETLQGEGVRDRIFAAGVVGAGRSARAAIDDFAAKRAEIGRKRGECRINGLRKRLDELDDALWQAKGRAAQHPALRHAADEVDDEQKSIGRELSEARREMAHLDALLAAWPDSDERCQVDAELASLSSTADLADDLGARLDAALGAARTQRDRDGERRQLVVQLDGQLAALAPDDSLATVSVDVKRLASRVGTVRARRERRGQLDTQFAALEKRVEEEAPRLGPGWTSKSVREFDASIPAAQEIADWGERLRVAEQAVREAEEQARQARTAAQGLADDLARRDVILKAASPLPEPGVLAERDSAVRKLRVKLPELVGLRADLDNAGERVAEAERRAIECRVAADAQRSECDRRSAALRSVSDLPDAKELLRRERAMRDLRAALAEVATAKAEVRVANQRALDAGSRAAEAESVAVADQAEVERRTRVLTDALSVPEADSLATLERTARGLRSMLMDLAVLHSDRRSAETRLADRRRDAERRLAPATVRSDRRSLLAVGAVLVGLAIVLLVMSQFVGAAVAFGAAVLTAMLAKWSSSAQTSSVDDPSAGVADAERAVQALVARVEEIEGAAAPLAAKLSFSGLPDLVALDTRSDEIAAQSRMRQDRDREIAALERLSLDARRTQESAKRLRSLATAAELEVNGPLTTRLHDVEAAARVIAQPFGFAALPIVSSLEEKAAEIQILAERRREHDREAHEVEALDLDATRAHDAGARLQAELSKLRADVDAAQATRLRAAQESALIIASSLGFDVVPEAHDVEERAKQLDLQVRARQVRDREAEAVEELRRRANTAEAGARRLSQDAAACRTTRETEQSAWSAWKAARRCPERLRPETAQQFFAAVERLRESLARLDEMRAEADTIGAELDAFSKAVASLVGQAGVAGPLESALPEDVLDGLRDRVDTDTKTRTERARIAGDLKKAREAQALSERDAVAAGDDVMSILTEAGASDERDCRARIETSRRRSELQKRARGAEHRMRTRLGIGTQADAVRLELASGNRQSWEARKQERKADLARLQPAHEEALRRHQDAVGKLTALEQESGVVALATERESVVSEIREALAEWRRFAIAQSLVQRTLRRYEIERQPAVLTRAAASFSRITDGRYVRLVTREDGIDVITADGSRFEATALSRGSAEQLYLCLRLALAGEFGRHAVPLPLVMDDILVNFDPERARLAAQVLLDATTDHQVLLFTCHPETVDLLIALDPEVRIVEMERSAANVRLPDAAASRPGDARADAHPAGAINAANDVEMGQAVIDALTAARRPLSRAELLPAADVPESRWTAVIQTLRASGRVVPHGRKRGTTWGLPEWAPDAESSA